MPQNINAHTSTQAAFVTTWTDVQTGTDNVDVTCTRALEEGKRHFITFLAISTDARLQDKGRGIGAILRSGSDTKYEIWPRSDLQDPSHLGEVADGALMMGMSTPTTISMDSDSGPWYVEFEAPIQMGLNEAATFVSDMDGDTDKVTFTMGGFTSDVSIY